MNRSMLFLAVVAAMCGAQTVAPAERRVMLIDAAQDAVNWYRKWYGNPTDASFLRTSSSGWAAVIGGQAYVALPDVCLGVELDVEVSTMLPRHVEELPRNMDGRAAVNAYIQRLRDEAAYVSLGKADRFGRPRRGRGPHMDALLRGYIRVLALGSVALPQRDAVPAGEEEQSRFVSFVKSTLHGDALIPTCEPKRATIPEYGIRDPLIFVLVEHGNQECGDFVIYFRRKGSVWSYDRLLNRFGDLDELNRRIRSHGKFVLEY